MDAAYSVDQDPEYSMCRIGRNGFANTVKIRSIEIRVGGCNAVDGPKDKQGVALFFSGTQSYFNHFISGNRVHSFLRFGSDHLIAGEASEGRQQRPLIPEAETGKDFSLVPFSRDKNGRVLVPGDCVTRTGIGCLGFVAEDERPVNMLGDNSIEPEWGRRRPGSEVVVPGDQGDESAGPALAPCVDGGAELPTAIDPAVH